MTAAPLDHAVSLKRFSTQVWELYGKHHVDVACATEFLRRRCSDECTTTRVRDVLQAVVEALRVAPGAAASASGVTPRAETCSCVGMVPVFTEAEHVALMTALNLDGEGDGPAGTGTQPCQWDRDELRADLQALPVLLESETFSPSSSESAESRAALLGTSPSRSPSAASVSVVGTLKQFESSDSEPDLEKLSEAAQKLVALGCPKEIAVLPEHGISYAFAVMSTLMPDRSCMPPMSAEAARLKAETLERHKRKHAAEYAREAARVEALLSSLRALQASTSPVTDAIASTSPTSSSI